LEDEMKNAPHVCAVISMTLCSGSLTAHAQQSESVCVEASVIRKCETDAAAADHLKGRDADANTCQRQLDVSDGSLQECQTTSQREAARSSAHIERLAREAGARRVERDTRPEWLHVVGYVTGALLVGGGLGYILGGR
jgi:hypothetical protein